MAEHIGKLFKAGNEKAKSGSDVFRIGIREGGNDLEYTLFDTDMIAKAKDAFEKDQPVKLTVSKPGKYWNLDAIETVTEEAAAKVINGREKHIAEQVAAKILAELWIADKVDRNSLEVRTLRAWLLYQMDVDPLVPGRKEELEPAVEESVSIDMSPILNIGQFYMRARKYFPQLKTKTDILGKLGYSDEAPIADLNEEWARLIVVMTGDTQIG